MQGISHWPVIGRSRVKLDRGCVRPPQAGLVALAEGDPHDGNRQQQAEQYQYYFRQVSLVSLLANPLVLPAQPPLMVLGGLAVILGLFSQPLGGLTAALAWPWVAYTIRIVELLANVRAAALSLGSVSVWRPALPARESPVPGGR